MIDLATKIYATKGWAETLEKRKWIDAFASGTAFDAQLKKYISETETVLKELGLT